MIFNPSIHAPPAGMLAISFRAYPYIPCHNNSQQHRKNMKLNHAMTFTAVIAAMLVTITAVESNFVFLGFYFGEYSERRDDAIVYEGSKWEIKYDCKVTAHGYGLTPPWMVDMARRFFGF
jgi:hypothetical protein